MESIHRTIHTGEKPNECQECQQKFRSASGLNRHIRDVHEKVKNFCCDLCDRRFASKLSRDEHRITHTDERPHTCEICGKSFKQKSSLYVHKLYHKEYCHQCTSCGKRFKRKADLDTHEYTHSHLKRFSCEICNKRFCSQGNVSRHKSIHRGNVYNCLCSSSFNQLRYLKAHQKRCHCS
ncbi:zinc finger protein 707-like [Prorops nasuta]|uniref:zinc finger protein 707-like n=1 Tax=Prorops nasuta TaxID=863751 RepID=UPI0034CD6C32